MKARLICLRSGRGRALVAGLASAATIGTALIAPAARADTPLGDPGANRTLSQSTVAACDDAPTSAACESDALADINAARASEGVAPMTLPAGFDALTMPQQLLALSDLERVDRGLTPILGLSASLDQDAASAAAQDRDPSPTNWYGDGFSANWEGGVPSTLEAEFDWMYDDGPGSDNVDCVLPGTRGCWGHRHDILYTFDPPIVMGAAAGTGAYGASMSELFVGGDTKTAPGQPDAPLAPTWATISAPSATASGSTTSSSGTTAAQGTSGLTGSAAASAAAAILRRALSSVTHAAGTGVLAALRARRVR